MLRRRGRDEGVVGRLRRRASYRYVYVDEMRAWPTRIACRGKSAAKSLLSLPDLSLTEGEEKH